MNTSETLHKAADLIEERGWADRDVDSEHAWGQDGGPVCLEGGIMAAAGIDFISDVGACPAYKAVHAYLDMPARARLYQFNDAIGRTQAEVIEVLRAAAAVEELQEAEARGPLHTGPTVRVPTQPGVGVA